MVSISGSGSIRRLKLKFQKAAYDAGSIYYAVQILKQLCTQCRNLIPTFVLNPVEETTEELYAILQQGQKGLTITQRKNVTILHADKLRTFGKRYILESNPDDAGISVTVIGSDRLHDFFIDITQSGNVLMSYRGLTKKIPARKETVVEVQLSVVPSSEFDSFYAYCYQTFCKGDLKRADVSTLKKMELNVSKLSLAPEPYVKIEDTGRYRRITAKEFKRMFGAKLLEAPIVVTKMRWKQDLKRINDSYCSLRPYIYWDLSYDEGIKRGSFRHVSEKSLLVRILNQCKTDKCHLPRVAIVKINDLVGNGLIAGEYIAPGMIIGEYSGEIVKMDPLAPNKSRRVDNTYFATYSLDTVPGSELFVIDAKKGGNPTRFINHSDANSNAVFVPVFDGKKFRLIVVAVKPIAEGKQLLLKYRSTYWLDSSIPKPIPL